MGVIEYKVDDCNLSAQPGLESFYEKNGCQRSLQSYMIDKKNGNGAGR